MSVAETLAALGITLPLRADPAYPGTIVDADNRDVCVVDYNGECSNEKAEQIAALLLALINGRPVDHPRLRFVNLPAQFVIEEARKILEWKDSDAALARELERLGYRSQFFKRLYRANAEHVWSRSQAAN
ncbi:hypothetical protein [Sphingomonas sp. BAUL-RG-20F-R05-02]|uniref:hypothetical protein n=1 Tax=Sphingomonas sp. BAUL-RG-20F-R05-02 TaxID=2914830 RepID=UPI001F5AE0E7|nr:hypothetical protein [Sphingomonas sp. BAUL-RG-20F-R05-02]